MLDISHETNLNNTEKEFGIIDNRFKEIDNTITNLKSADSRNKTELANLLREKEDLTKKINDSK